MEKPMGWLVAVALLVICCVTQVRSDGSDHKYKSGDSVPLYANNIGPFRKGRVGIMGVDSQRSQNLLPFSVDL
ncbi:hypothetical protein NMG60_11002708 [Bertholletia excelsa]